MDHQLNSMTTFEDSSSSNNTLNPFEAASIDSLHLTHFSPSVFAKNGATPITGSSEKSGKFRWSIDHLAVLHPADIDEYPLQQESTLDSDAEDKAQQAIDQFFSQQHVVPSPWSVKRPIKQVTFSPNPTTISEDNIVESPVCSRPEVISSIKQQERSKGQRSEVSCQTIVTLPIDFDLQSALGDKYMFNDSDIDDVNEFSTSSLRRKLFSQGTASPTISPVEGGIDHESPNRIPDIPSPQVSPIRQADDLTLSGSDYSLVKTPCSMQSQFSSSPISSKVTPCRWTPHRQGSPEPADLNLPSFSPISSTVYTTQSDSSRLRHCTSSDVRKAPSSVLILPEASPILPDMSRARTGMMYSYLASVEPSTVEMMPVPSPAASQRILCAENNHGAYEKDEPSSSFPVDNDKTSISDGTRSDHGDLHDSVDSQSSSPTAASICSMEQSQVCLKGSDECLWDEERSLNDGEQDMTTGSSSSKHVYDNTPSFQAEESISNHAPITQLRMSTLKLPCNIQSVSGVDPISLQSTTGNKCRTESAALVGPLESSPWRKLAQRDVLPSMHSDSGFNSQSFTSMEVTDSEVMNTNEYSVDDGPMRDKGRQFQEAKLHICGSDL